MNFSVKNIFSKCEHIRIKMQIHSHLLNRSLTETLFFVLLILLELLLSLASFSSNLIASLAYTLHYSTLDTDYSCLLFRNKFLVLAVNNSTFTLA